MNLLPINYQQPIPTFKGLWGHSYTQHSNYDRGHCIVETFDYHPFGNESRDFVQNVVDSETQYIWSHYYDGAGLYKSMVSVKDKLPFTQEEFNLYKKLKGKKLTKTGIKVEKSLAEAKLYKYLNNKYKYFLCEYFRPVKKMISKATRFIK